jgi:hypothetical protein
VHGKVILTAPSNAAVANLALNLVRAPDESFDQFNIMVWGDNCDESVRFLNATHRQRRYNAFRRAFDSCSHDAEKLAKLEEFAKWLHLPHSMIHDADAMEQLCARPMEECMASTGVLLCTVNTAGSRPLRKATDQRFPLLILDEAGQCTEAKFYIQTTFPGVKRIVMFGYPRQLPATVCHPGCEQAGYGESFLSHLLEFVPHKVHLLNVQYRMDPTILKFCNDTFYSSRIKSYPCVFNRTPKVGQPFEFIDTAGLGDEQPCGHSWMNETEAHIIKAVLCTDPDIAAY